jgi:phage baseplate assembly protein W
MSTEALPLAFPFVIDTRGCAATTDANSHLRDLIMLVLFTAPGERVNRPEFGCGLKQLVFSPASDALVAATEQLIHGALIRWLDPVLSVQSVQVRALEEILEITVVYTKRDTGEKREEVFRHSIPA